jgi:hypothetical protein
MNTSSDRSPRLRRHLCAGATLALAASALAIPGAASGARPAGGVFDAAPRLTGTAAAAPNTSQDAVLQWNVNAANAAIAACIAPNGNPLLESRMYAEMQLAIHDALNAIHLRSQPYALHAHVSGASPPAAVASAAKNTLVPIIRALPDVVSPECIDAGAAKVLADYDEAMSAIPDGIAKARGQALGRAAAQLILAVRTGDGSHTQMVDPDYPEGTEPGQWRFTPGAPFAFAPRWGKVTTFALRSSRQFFPEPPYSVTSERYTADFKEVKRLGGDDVTTPSDRTPEQTQIALFWLENSPLMWNAIARTVSQSQHLDMWQNARLFALLNAGLADGYIASFEAKYDYKFWRPVTAIQLAADDGNPNTDADPTWTPLVPTPPIPDHESAHAIEGGIGAWVMREFFGTNHIRFTACSQTLPEGQNCGEDDQVNRTYHSFTQAAAENGWSRVLIGFHFRHAEEAGIARGHSIGVFTVNHLLRPVH